MGGPDWLTGGHVPTLLGKQELELSLFLEKSMICVPARLRMLGLPILPAKYSDASDHHPPSPRKKRNHRCASQVCITALHRPSCLPRQPPQHCPWDDPAAGVFLALAAGTLPREGSQSLDPRRVEFSTSEILPVTVSPFPAHSRAPGPY